MSAFAQRRKEDLQKLRQLAASHPARITIAKVSGDPPNEIEVVLTFKTAPSQQYPRVVQERTHVVVSLPARYPFVAPTVIIRTPILHPNVYVGGTVCLGTTWLPASGLDLLVKRLIQIITFDVTVLNEQSPANRDALAWYQSTRAQNPQAFPTDSGLAATVEQGKTMTWSNVTR
jgi:ubiquitin-protein ligase